MVIIMLLRNNFVVDPKIQPNTNQPKLAILVIIMNSGEMRLI
jgi:hypothetical protein